MGAKKKDDDKEKGLKNMLTYFQKSQGISKEDEKREYGGG